ncbi:hypothetical protein, partial [Nocardia gipuzkoensis]|uniref:hypothetical protein n=1 Tax=Nocardia gipuzkoensis TaxID=2749991 RepID=UPI002458A954
MNRPDSGRSGRLPVAPAHSTTCASFCPIRDCAETDSQQFRMFAVVPTRLSDTPKQLLAQNTLPSTFVPLIFAVAIQADTSDAKEHHWAPESTRRVATAWAWRGECTAFRSLLSRRRSRSTVALGSPRSSVPRGTVSLPCGTVRPHPRSGGYLLPQAEPEFEVGGAGAEATADREQERPPPTKETNKKIKTDTTQRQEA